MRFVTRLKGNCWKNKKTLKKTIHHLFDLPSSFMGLIMGPQSSSVLVLTRCLILQAPLTTLQSSALNIEIGFKGLCPNSVGSAL